MKQFFLLVTGICFACFVKAQGCSDAGFCSLKYHAAGAAKNSIAVGNVSGFTDGNTFVNSSYISFSRRLGENVNWDTKLTANYASGSLANNFNAGDILTSFSFSAFKDKLNKSNLGFLGGLKIPLTAANDKASGKPLPMAYQSSLGTYDLLLGADYNVNKWEFTQAWQIPLTQQNKNTFIQQYSVSNDFVSTNKFHRTADALVRVAYNIKNKTSKFLFKPNLLAVYHLADDSYEDIYAARKKLAGSKGLTLNANVIARYSVARMQQLELSVAAPFVVRDIRPDGLTREFTAGLEYKISF